MTIHLGACSFFFQGMRPFDEFKFYLLADKQFAECACV